MTPEDVKRSWLKRLDELEKSLEHPEPLLKEWGALMVESSQRAFVDQQFGDIQWAPRYPGMAPPFLNIAGTLEDFNAGRSSPKPNRFQDRPALVDQGMAGGLQGSITYAVSRGELQVGTNKPYGQLHQEGGKTSIRVSEEAYKAGRSWLFKNNGKPRKGREEFVSKLWPALFRRSLRQNVVPRPFLGVTDELARNLVQATEEYFEGKES